MTPDARDRYSRQIRFAGVGEEGQERLFKAHAVIAGCGALGSFQAGALARAGVGTLTVIDRDYVESSNLQRQWLFEESDAAAGVPKAIAAARRISGINSACSVRPLIKDLTASNAEELLEGADLILDGTDNFETRYLINDFAVREKIPWVYGAAVGSYGIVMPVIPGLSACLACVYPEPPQGAQPTCETSGVLNAVTSAVASMQVGLALKILVGKGAEIARRITTLDVWEGTVRQIQMPERQAGCAACGRHDYLYLEHRRGAPVSLCGRDAVQIHDRNRPLDLDRLGQVLALAGTVRANEFALRFTIPPYEMMIFPDGRAIIKGTTDVGVARSLYSRYIGN